ncbi:MAG: WcaF family extracellular polysaccharide biosynthesis acetyltransferase [Chloracidobacterium sp.]|uniref:WcaF family extracellular polysaccharide biosynthesis acetyltransferase n=1 Tax=Chloracidobacterium validum TaxID=2821543 RepID=A0ABX8BD71_9BACT|nr:WcaF family extracellular polysaccharide biosynthesis acetyltransferase [Chloracidobacterium validum]QUW04639.1 WcaF family extracellular polysaccharide biosynthesis acetyltransferase [Chloracidobacterium validum]
MTTVDLSRFNNAWYRPGPPLKRALWLLINAWIFKSDLPYPSALKARLLRLFGARIGRGVVIKPNVNIKYPWLLAIGDFSWIGEGAWIDNLADVAIGAHACISQGAYLLTGNHDYTAQHFDLMIAPITIGDGAWVGAKSIVLPGTRLESHVVVAAGSVIGGSTEPYGIYRGAPAQWVRQRVIRSVAMANVS